MSTCVLQWSTASASIVVNALAATTGGSVCEIRGLSPQRCDELNYNVEVKSIRESMDLMIAESIVAVSLRDSQGRIGLIFRPRFCGSRLNLWVGSFEFYDQADAQDAFQRLLLVDELMHISIANEEPLDLDESETIDASTFPWSHWRLIAAAVMTDVGWRRHPQAESDVSWHGASHSR